jgi:hypothetical protein
MIFKSSPRAAVSSAACLLLLAGPLRAQLQPAPSPSPAVKPKQGFARLWNVLPLPGYSLELVIGADANGKVLQTAQPSNIYAGYSSLPPGRYVMRVFRTGDRQNPIKSFDVQLRDKSYFDILVSQAPGASPTAELIDETPDPTQDPVNRLTVRQFCPGATVVITAGGVQRTDSLVYGATQTLSGLPNGLVPLSMRAVKGSGSAKTWNTEADFRVAHRASLFIIADAYGRIRARTSIDGPSVADEAAAASPAHSP